MKRRGVGTGRAQARRDHRGDEPRGGQLPLVLEVDDILQPVEPTIYLLAFGLGLGRRWSATSTGSTMSSSSAPEWSPRR